MTDVAIGTAIVACIEPHPGRAREFNRWYERDHFYAAVTGGPGAFAGARWVATRACKELRPAGASWLGDSGRGSFLTTAWLLDGAQEEWDAWVARQMTALQADPPRTFSGRDHVHTAVYRFAGEAREPGGVTAAVALDHPFAGVIAALVPGGAAAGRELAIACSGAELPVAAVLVPERVIRSEVQLPEHALVLAFSVTDPIAAWDARVAPALAAGAEVGFASPFVRTIPGTDAYVDDL